MILDSSGSSSVSGPQGPMQPPEDAAAGLGVGCILLKPGGTHAAVVLSSNSRFSQGRHMLLLSMHEWCWPAVQCIPITRLPVVLHTIIVIAHSRHSCAPCHLL
jgi:hypothetical protein